jgi:hypothetical protein
MFRPRTCQSLPTVCRRPSPVTPSTRSQSNPGFLRLTLACLLAVSLLPLTGPDTSAQTGDMGPGLQRAALGLGPIQQRDLEEMMSVLASERYAGRLTGTAGYDLAARWGAERFRAAGLVPGGADGSWYQPFQVEACKVTGPMELRVVRADWVEAPYTFGDDYVARGFTGSGRVEDTPVVFVGWGLQDRTLGRDDYTGAAVRGKVALMFMGAPPGADWGEKSRPRSKATLAARLGARAILFIDDPGKDAPSPIISVYHGQEGSHQPDLPLLSIRNRVADDLLRGTGHTAADLRSALVEGQKVESFELPVHITLEAHAEYRAAAPTWNVIGWIEGSDPTVADEWVMVGGHLDHVGSQSGIVFPGARDNASGSVMVVALAQAMAAAPIRPRRSVCFVLFAGEELFLLGSEYFATHAPRPLDHCAGMINLDMPGGGDALRVMGGASTPEFQQMVVEADRLFGGFGLAEQRPTPAVAGASDHSAFVERDVPTLYIAAAGGPSVRAHTAADRIDTIDYEAFTRTARVVYLTLFQMADRP